jgi:glycosyltransferase involved in cell wall biosynthesis
VAISHVVVLSPEPWTALPTNKHQLAQGLSKFRPVLYVDLSGQSLVDLVRERSLRGPRLASANLWIACPPVLPKRLRTSSSIFLYVNSWLSNLMVRWWLHRMNWHRPKVLAYFPSVVWGLCLLDSQAIIYHCVDHHASFPDWAKLEAALTRAEKALVKRSSVVVATSAALVEHLSKWRPDIRELGNVADVELFGAAARADRPCRLTKPRAFFHGAFSEHKVDFGLLTELVTSDAVATLRLVGPISTEGARRKIDQLLNSGRVSYAGQLPQSEIPAGLADVDVLVLPFLVDTHTIHVFPLKLIEYLATGLPIVATRLPTIINFAGQALGYVESASDFAAAYEYACQPSFSTIRQDLIVGETWARRTADFMELIGE